LSGPLKALGVSAAVYAAKGIVRASITASSERDNSILNNGTTCDVAFCQNVLTIYYCYYYGIAIFEVFTQCFVFSTSLRCADRRARRSGSAQGKYSISHHIVIKPFLLNTDLDSVINICPGRTKLTALEAISRSRDMVDAHQNLNGSRDLTTPLSGMVCHPWASTCYLQPTYQI